MKFFIDTANVEEIKEAAGLGLVDGVTTNPTLLSMENREFEPLVREICGLVDGPVSLEVIGSEASGMVDEAKKLAAISDNVVIKVPMTMEGLKATGMLKSLGISTNMTLVFSATQAILAAKAGAAYVSPFIGRLDDISAIGMDLVADIVEIFDNYEFGTEIIVASIRNPLHVLDAATMGADIATIPFKVINQLVKHPLTDLGIQKFLADWEKVPKK